MNTTTRKASKHHYFIGPVKTDRGVCPAHILIRHQPEWMTSTIKSVVFWTMMHDTSVEILVHWMDVTRYMKKASNAANGKGYPGEIKAVILEDGSRIHCTSRSVHYNDDKAYFAAPMFARDSYMIECLGSRTTMLEVLGVHSFAYTNRSAEAIAALIHANTQRIECHTGQLIEGEYHDELATSHEHAW